MSAEHVILATTLQTAFDRPGDENPGSVLHVALVIEPLPVIPRPTIELAVSQENENAPMRVGRYDRRSVAIGGISPAQARTLAASLVAMADEIDRFYGRKGGR